MANLFTTPAGLGVIAKEAIVNLQPNLIAAATMYRGVDSEYKNIGDTANIRKPAVLEADEFTEGTEVTIKEIKESTVPVKLDKLLTVDVEITSKEMSLDIIDLRSQVIVPAIQGLARKIDTLAFALYKDIYKTVGAAGTTPDGLDDIAGCDRVLNEANVPFDGKRYLAINPLTREKFLQLASVYDASVVGDAGSALRSAAIGDKLGMKLFLSQNLPSHTRGTSASGTATGTSGASAITVASGGNAGTFKKGDIITIATITTTNFVVTADKTLAADGSGEVAIYPPLPASVSGQAITYIASHKNNLFYHESAFCIASAPLAPAAGMLSGYETYDGFSIRTVYGYNQKLKKNMLSLDMLTGYKTINPDRAGRLLG